MFQIFDLNPNRSLCHKCFQNYCFVLFPTIFYFLVGILLVLFSYRDLPRHQGQTGHMPNHQAKTKLF